MPLALTVLTVVASGNMALVVKFITQLVALLLVVPLALAGSYVFTVKPVLTKQILVVPFAQVVAHVLLVPKVVCATTAAKTLLKFV